MIVTPDHPENHKFRWWLEQQIGPLHKESLVIATINDKTAAVAALTKWSETDCELTVAAIKPGWATRSFFAYIADLVFEQNGCLRCTAKIAESNRKSWRAVERAGFQLEGVMRKAHDTGEDLRIYGMLKEECKWAHQPVPEE